MSKVRPPYLTNDHPMSITLPLLLPCHRESRKCVLGVREHELRKLGWELNLDLWKHLFHLKSQWWVLQRKGHLNIRAKKDDVIPYLRHWGKWWVLTLARRWLGTHRVPHRIFWGIWWLTSILHCCLGWWFEIGYLWCIWVFPRLSD